MKGKNLKVGLVSALEEYKLYAGPGGRKVARRIKNYKRNIFIMGSILFSEAAIIGGLITYIIKELN